MLLAQQTELCEVRLTSNQNLTYNLLITQTVVKNMKLRHMPICAKVNKLMTSMAKSARLGANWLVLAVSFLCLAHKWLPYLSAVWYAQPAHSTGEVQTKSREEIAEEMNRVQKSHKEEGQRRKNRLTDKQLAMTTGGEQNPSQV